MHTKFVRFYFQLIALVTLVFGLVLLFFPNFAASLFFENLGLESLFFLRICGSTLIGYAALNGLAVHANKKDVYAYAAWSNLVTLSIATVICFFTIPSFDKNAWILPVQHVLFTSGFIYCLLKIK